MQKEMKKQIANIITSLRIVGSISMLFFSAFSVGFYVNYLFCGFTDMIDGLIARKTGTVSKFGAKLDSVADLVFVTCSCIKLVPTINLPIWIWVWGIFIAIVKIVKVIQKKKLFSHTLLNKITGLLLFLFPLTMDFINPIYFGVLLSVLATASISLKGDTV